ncbi:MAG: hypothetical protein EOO02_09480 [Chitinophagaceae bacterium]|nr:MAG: hypothetical protein EOO02_09480 [Chitinophagaceae bacterium]
MLGVSDVSAQLTYKDVVIDYDSAVEFKNLKVIPVRKKSGGGTPALPSPLSFGQAMQSGRIAVTERGTASTENVHWLRINNNSGEPVFVASGEVVMGGRQDRMVTKDTILESMPNDQYIPVMCVEEDRWSEKEKKFKYASFANPALRRVLDQHRNQVLVWKEVYAQLDSSKIKSPTLAYAAKKIDKKNLLQTDEYLRYFTKKLMGETFDQIRADSNIVGFVCITGSSIIGTDIYSDQGLFTSQFETLLTGYIETAITDGAKPAVNDADVKKYLDQFLTDEARQEVYLKKNGKIFRRDGRVYHITAY